MRLLPTPFLSQSVAVPAKPNASTTLKIILLLAVVACAALGARYVSREQALALIERAQHVGWPGYLLFILGYGIWCSLGLPASILTLGAAAAFGFWRGLALVLAGATLGAFFGFLMARYVASEWFGKIVGKKMTLAQINRAVAERGWKVVMLTRLPPVSPFSLLSYAYGLTSVRLRDFMIGTAIGMIPGTTAYVYLGTILGHVAAGAHRSRTPLEWTIYIAGFIATVAVCIYLVRLAKDAVGAPVNE
jgi:uncharacterized membrane protein YdjX (TVP38/TMEM64 family)